ncbi:MAG: aspartate/glutamate racemase family protein, partial [Candidatus Woesearchaeota archaeon]|nr:aspartate/glutamate racemase family protein [Candidatus Woesearchaeota archaeon]
IIIYCNSLSGAIDLKKIREDNKIEILTPLDVYAQIANSYRLFGLIAANCQSAANIERTIIGANNDAIVIGIGNLNIVNEIERGGRPIDIIRRHNVVELCNVIAASGAEMIILGCTHFSFFHDELKKMIPHILLEPSEEMGKRLR